jgi:hypothetical protein
MARQLTIPTNFVTSTVMSVVLRAGGRIHTEVKGIGRGTLLPQVNIRLGDLLLFITDVEAMRRVRQQWDAQQFYAQRLPEEAPAEWVQATPGTYPATAALRLTSTTGVAGQWVPGSVQLRTPPHVRMVLDRCVWQVVDRTAWNRISDALHDGERHMSDL